MPASNASGDKEKIRLLIVDDIPETRENLRKLLFFESDIDVVGAATNGEEGIQMAVELQPDIVLMDVTMPKVNGIEALKQIIRFDQCAKVVICSALGSQPLVIEALKAGAQDYIVKPNFGNLNNILINLY